MRKSIVHGFRRVPSCFRACAVLLSMAPALACSRSEIPVDDGALKPALGHYAALANAVYDDAVQGVGTLAGAVRALADAPSELTLNGARQAYLNARVPYRASEVFRFYGGPIDDVEVAVNTWPIDESFVEGSGEGIIEDRARYPELTSELLASLNARDGETAISTGYHVIEFLLWGRDDDPAGPGKRSARDFGARAEGDAAADPEEQARAQRRVGYLSLSTALLAKQLAAVRDAWREGRSDNYRARFLALPPREALSLAVRGMGTLSGPELAGERLTVGYETRDQENEQSCFSDTTSADIAGNAAGIESVCTGALRRSSGAQLRGPGLCAAIALLSPELARTLSTEISESVRHAQAIPSPFDQALLGRDDAPGRSAIAGTIRALRAQATSLARVSALLRAPPALASTP